MKARERLATIEEWQRQHMEIHRLEGIALRLAHGDHQGIMQYAQQAALVSNGLARKGGG
jgi:hypothetical protein